MSRFRRYLLNICLLVLPTQDYFEVLTFGVKLIVYEKSTRLNDEKKT